MINSNLKFRRQYLITHAKYKSFSHWQNESFGSFQIYAHPDIELTIAKIGKDDLKLALIGYMLDPSHPDWSNVEILNAMQDSVNSIDDISKYLYSISGRFVLVVNSSVDTFIFHDPCGLRTAYYAKHKGKIHVASQPLLFKDIIPLKKGDKFNIYQKSEYKKNNKEHWIPSGYSLYDDIYHLVPNHYLQFSTFKQERYWPKKKLQNVQLNDAVHDVSELLKKLMEAANHRFDLALPLTAGWDSRILLSASKDIMSTLFLYTLQYRDLQLDSKDIRIPKEILDSLDYKHHIIDCRKEPNLEFTDIYEKNVSMAHNEDWGKIAYGMFETYPSERVCIKGNAVEIGRLSSLSLPKIQSVDEIIDYRVPGWKTVPFIKNQLSSWYIDAGVVATECEIDLHSLFYWEHRMGSWQAQSQIEWDIVQEVFTPFNHRALLEITLGVSPKFRSAPKYVLYQKIAETLWSEVMDYPINPPENIRERLLKILSYFGLKEVIKKIYKKIFH